MKIYLAGKMDSTHGAWRDAILGTVYDVVAQRQRPSWELVRDSEAGDIDLGQIGIPPWPTAPNTRVLGMHEYVGPYRTTYSPEIDSKYTGYFHGSTVTGQHGQSNWDDHPAIIQECWKAIHRSDLFFAYINSPDCFGTMAEIGMAKALGIYVVAAFEEGADWEGSDYWFCGQLCDAVVRCSDRVEVGPEPARPRWGSWVERAAPAGLDDYLAWEKRRDNERERISRMMKDAIIHWTARPEKPSPVAMVRHDEREPYIRALQEAAGSLSQIARWSSDPRVRNEAQRMLKRIAG